MKRFALSVCAAAALAVGAASAFGADAGWYVGTGVGPSKTRSRQHLGNINNELATPAPRPSVTTGITKDNKSIDVQVFVGYNVTSFLALEAMLSDWVVSCQRNRPTAGAAQVGQLDVWGGSSMCWGSSRWDPWRLSRPGRGGRTSSQRRAGGSYGAYTNPAQPRKRLSCG